MHRLSFICFFFCLSSLLCGVAEASINILVQGSQAQQSSQDQTSSSSSIVVPQTTEHQDIPALLQASPGVNVTRYGSHESFAAVSLRGSSAGEVTYYLGNIPLSGAGGSFNSWDLFPTSFLRALEVYRGANPGKLVDSSAGGSIVFLPQAIPEKFTASTFANYGSFQTLGLGANAAAPHKMSNGNTLGWQLSLDHERSKGDFSFLDTNGTLSNKNDDSVIDRVNNDFATTRAAGSLGLRLQKSELSFNNFFLNKDEGIPGFSSPQASSTRLRTTHNLFAVHHTFPQLTSSLKLHSSAFADWQWQRFSDPQSEIGLGNQNTSDHLLRVGLQSRPEWQINAENMLTAFLAYRSELFFSEDKNKANSSATSSRNKISAGIESEHYFLHDHFLLNPSARAELLLNRLNLNKSGSQQYGLGNESSKNLQFSGKLGMSEKISANITLQSNIGTGFRPPNFSELFGDRGTLVGNPELASEHSLDADFGIVADKEFHSAFNHLYAETFFFYHWINNVIQFVQTSQLTAQAQNLSKAQIYGIETAAAFSMLRDFSLKAAYTFQQAKDISGKPASDGLSLPGRPQHIADISGTYQHKWKKNFSSSVMSQAHFTSGNFLDTQNFLMADSRVTWDSGLQLTFLQRTQLCAQAKNILNSHISDLVGYPLPGRSFSLGVSYAM